MKKRLLVLLMMFGVIAAACGSNNDIEAAATEPVETVEDEEAMEDDAMEDEEAMEDDAMEDDAMEDDAMEDVTHDLSVASSDLGQILVDAAGNTLYLFTNDEQGAGTSACEGGCLAAWPAVGEITSPSGGVNADLVGSIERADGTIQATYNGWPLYTFASDSAPGDVNGQAVNDIWWVLDVDGNAIGS